MRINLWTQYGALNSKPVFDAFKQGAESLGHICVENNLHSDVDVIWSVLFSGRMAANKDIWERNIAVAKPTIVLEVGGIRRGTTWKVGLNGINRTGYFGEQNNNEARANLLGLSLTPWRSNGECILICGQHDKSLQWQNMPKMSEWVITTIETLRAHTDRPIVFRPHPRSPLPNIEYEFKNVRRQNPVKLSGTYDDYNIQFSNIHAVVSWSSNPGIHSILNGVPAFVGSASLAYDVANTDLSQIEDPLMPDRRQWLNDYAHTEWTIQEIAKGVPLKRLTNMI